MIRNLKKMMGDEGGVGIIQACIVEAVICINPLSWLCCLPCLLGPIGVLSGIIVDVILAPLEILAALITALAVSSGAMTPKNAIDILIHSLF
jgi:hypothetical protein